MGNAISHGMANDENVIVQVTYDKAGRRVALRDPRGEQMTYAYDQLDRRTSLSNPLSQAWATTYSDLSGGRRRVTRTNPLGQQVEEDYDRLGRLVAVRYLSETPKHTPDVVFCYDAAGNRTAMDETLDGGVTWLRKTQYGYDGVGRLVSVGFDTNGDGVVEQTVTYQYDAGGRRTQMTMPGNRTVQYAYDVKGQLVSLTDWDGQTTRYRYDHAGRLREAQGPNLLTRRWRYDAAGRLRHLRHSREGKTLGDFAYEVDKRGNRTQVRECLPQAAGTTVLTHSNPAIDYVRGTWAAVGDFHETTNMGAALRAEVFGTELTLVMGAGPDHSVYDVYLNGTLRDSLDGYAATPGERSLTYSLTDEGPHTVEVRNRTDKNLVSSGYKLRFKRLETNRRYDLHTIQYSYDRLERLRAADYRPAANLSAAPFRQHGYAYDVAGNRTQVNDNGAITNYTYNAANQITNPGFSYDAAGRMTSDGVNAYTWDRADRLLSMGGVQNQYNGLGQRVQQSVGAQVTQYLLDTQPGLWQVLAATTSTDTTRYVHGPTGLQQQQNPDNAWVYPAQDGLGSVRSVADEGMAVLESRQYEPYGEPWGITGAPQTDFGFTGEPTDENGLVYLRARHYDPRLGVFPSLDPVVFGNRYQYAQGSPTNHTDPSGLGDPCSLTYQPCIGLLEGAGAALGAILTFLAAPLVAASALTVAVGGVMIYVSAQTPITALTAEEITRLIAAQTYNIPPVNVAERLRITAEVYAMYGVTLTAQPQVDAPAVPTEYPDTTMPPGVDVWRDTEIEWQRTPIPSLQPEPVLTPELERLPFPPCTSTPSPKIDLYHYTFEANIPDIIVFGLKPSLRAVRDAEYGDGQYFTDLPPGEASTVKRTVLSYAFFRVPYRWGYNRDTRAVGWLEFSIEKERVQRVAPLYGNHFPARSIYLYPNSGNLSVVGILTRTGIVSFQL